MIKRLLYRIISRLPRSRIKIKIRNKVIEYILFEKIRVFFARMIFESSGRNINIGSRVSIGKNVKIGDYSGIGDNCKIASGTIIGKNVMIATECLTFTSNHEMSRTDVPMQYQGRTKMEKIYIGDDTWIGSRVIILPGVKIGKGSVIGAGCVLAKSVPEYSVVVGNPGKVIKNRKTKERIKEWN